MATFNKFNTVVQNFGAANYTLASDGLWLVLSNTSPNAADIVYNHTGLIIGNTSNAAELTTANGYTTGGAQSTGNTWVNSTGTSTLSGSSVVWTASGGSIGPFRYVVMYDITFGTTATRPLIGWWDYGSALTVTTGNTFTVTFGSGILTLA